MSNLLPSHTANEISKGLSEYLTTSFSLASEPTAEQLRKFLLDPQNGMFYGPYVRTRLPYAPAEEWDGLLFWLPKGFKPYHHQAEAFRRLRSVDNDGTACRPKPTLVVTGTGSGKTESFLYPILDHCKRARSAGQRTGVKAIILYPMNALANDQAQRLAKLLSADPALAGVTAGIYTGESSIGGQERVSSDQLITSRKLMRVSPPDILLTNYKMLDQLLLREEDKGIWELSANTLQYLVLDEFHTYDAAQGTDVALLLRRLGLAIKRSQEDGFLDDEYASLPLGRITPVATSATLGGGPDSDGVEEILQFAYTVFGEKLEQDAIVGEKILSVEEWQNTIEPLTGFPLGDRAPMPSVQLIQELLTSIYQELESGGVYEDVVHRVLCDKLFSCASSPIQATISAMANNEVILGILESAKTPVPLLHPESHPGSEVPIESLAQRVFADAGVRRRLGNQAAEFLSIVLSEMAHVRAIFGEEVGWDGKKIPGVEAQLWVREISRIDRVAGNDADGMFRWSDDGYTQTEAIHTEEDSSQLWLPAIYCRHCGRSGWNVAVQVGDEHAQGVLETSAAEIRRISISSKERIRPLLDAASEAATNDLRDGKNSKVAWLDLGKSEIINKKPEDGDLEQGTLIPVLMYAGDQVEDFAKDERCPSCNKSDGIRYLGSSVTTLLSVALNNLFGMADLDNSEKKTLVFADSVQDAAHRAGFVQDRSRTFALRSQINNAVRQIIDENESKYANLGQIAERMVSNALSIPNEVESRQAIYDLLSTEFAHAKNFTSAWEPGASKEAFERSLRYLTSSLNMDLVLEFGERVELPRTLVNTGSLTVAVDVSDDELISVASQVGVTVPLDPMPVVSWGRGVLEKMRIDGGIYHRLLEGYLNNDCKTVLLNLPAIRAQGMPPFPRGIGPIFPRRSKTLAENPVKNGHKIDLEKHAVRKLDQKNSWYDKWTKLVLGSVSDSTTKVSNLFKAFEDAGILNSKKTENGVVYYIEPERIRISYEDKPRILECTSCSMRLGLDAAAREGFKGSRCLNTDCNGHFEEHTISDNYYENLYHSSSVRSIVAEEHTSLISSKKRAKIEAQFKGKVDNPTPDSPNVLVATPTLEMGIDIGDLSTVMLASMPATVASYVQRVGRAGRLTGNSLILAMVRGRGRALTKLEHPLETIAGAVTAPAAYLSAREILHRQFLAYLLDKYPIAEKVMQLHTAKDVFSLQSGSACEAIIEIIRNGIETELDEFGSTLRGHTADAVLDELKKWAQSETGLISDISKAVKTWNDQYMEAVRRLDTLQKELLSLEELLEAMKGNSAIANAETAGQEVENEGSSGKFDPGAEFKQKMRRVKASMLSTNRELNQLKSDHWVAALERFGLLPNFTLLDDSVDFQLAVNSRDVQTNEFNTSTFSYNRGVSSALTELAPGNTFYVEKIAAEIDTVDLGMDQSELKKWRVCPECSYAEVQEDTVSGGPCPSCGTPHFEDVGQLIDVVEMQRVAATVDGSKTGVRSFHDERKSARYQVNMAFSVPEGGQGPAWFLKNSGFGMQYLPMVTMRWLNLGQVGQGLKLRLSGREVNAPRFRLCEYCGHLDSDVGQNRWQDHNPWCIYRTGKDEHSMEIALGRTLTTQGVLVYIPGVLSTLEKTTLPSLLAALKMGFKMYLGGNPDHLDIESVKVATSKESESENAVADALLIHDKVPGGTGYLAQFTDPMQVEEMLKVAFNHLVNCSCVSEQREVCPSCLLPYVPSSHVQLLSREAAAAALFKILNDDVYCEAEEDASNTTWKGHITKIRPKQSDRSALEERAIALLREGFEGMRAKISEGIRENFAYWTIKIPGQNNVWILREQEKVGPTVPDITLRHPDPNMRDIAIYLDGKQYHIGNLRDDFNKRNYLYESGLLPLSITWDDVDARREVVYGNREAISSRNGNSGGPEISRDLSSPQIVNDPFTLLFAIMLKVPLNSGDPQDGERARAELEERIAKVEEIGFNAFANELNPDHDQVATGYERRLSQHVLIRVTDSALGAYPEVEIELGDDKVSGEDWKKFLCMANFAYLQPEGAKVIVSDRARAPIPVGTTGIKGADSRVENKADQVATGQWQEVLEEYDADVDILPTLERLIELDIPAPDLDLLGYEFKGTQSVIGWESSKLLLSFPGDAEELAKAVGDDYTVVEADFGTGPVPDAVMTLLNGGE